MAISDYRARLNELKGSITQLNNTVIRLFGEARDRINLHTQSKGNVHGLTTKELGLENVRNYPPSTSQQAKDGKNNNTVMTPKRTYESLDENVFTPLTEIFNDAAERL